MRTISALALSTILLLSAWIPAEAASEQEGRTNPPLFVTSDRCVGCHNGIVTPSGEDVSIGPEWRSGMMANSARDPYWQAAVRREALDHPAAGAAIENECSRCHMPMMHVQEGTGGRKGQVFAHLPVVSAAAPASMTAADGVSCSLCHQIQARNLGSAESFTGGFVVDTTVPPEQREVFGQFDVDKGRRRIMSSSSSFIPTLAAHLGTSEFCATCHTLFTHSLNSAGETVATLPEQVPYLEWKHSGYRETNNCQSCHMPVVENPVAITSVLGEPRSGFLRHNFLGGNFFVLGLLGSHRDELGVQARSQELSHAANRTIEHLKQSSARVVIEEVRISGGRLEAAVRVASLAGHKLPTAYPSRRVWLHVTLRDRSGSVLFDSGAPAPDGSIAGNDNDRDGTRYEPHYLKIDDPGQVQIYEAIMADSEGNVTTGLLTGVRYLKDNRILPRGFEKGSAPADVRVQGAAMEDSDFTAGEDRVTYSISLNQAPGPYRLEAQLWYQPIGYRWAHNLSERDSEETRRFVSYYKGAAANSAIRLTGATIEVR